MKKPLILNIINNKGGVAKTSTTKNLAAALALLKKKVAVVDIDDQHNLTSDYNDDYPYDLLTTDKTLKQLQHLKSQDQYDYILIDSPPDLGKETVSGFMVSDYLIIPTNLAGKAIDGMQATIEAMNELKSNNPNLQLLGVLVTFFDRRDREADNLLKALKTSLKSSMFDTLIRVSSTIKRSDDEKRYVQEYEKSHWIKKSTEDFHNLAKEVIKKTK